MQQNSVVSRIQSRYDALSDVERMVTVNVNRRPDPNGGFMIENGRLVLVKPYQEWTRTDLRYVERADLQGLMVLAAHQEYGLLQQITPRSFGSARAFGAAVMDEWIRQGQHINKRFLAGYLGDDPATGDARFAPGYGPGTSNDPRPQSERDYERRYDRPRSPLRPVVPGIGGMAFNDLTPNARPDSEHDLVSPNVLARAERAVKDLKSSVVLAA